MNTHRYTVPGMHCGGCRKRIESAIAAVDPDAQVTADTQDKTVTVKTGENYARVRDAITSAGYEVDRTANDTSGNASPFGARW